MTRPGRCSASMARFHRLSPITLLILLLLPSRGFGQGTTLQFRIPEEGESSYTVGILGEQAKFRDQFPSRYKSFTYALMRGPGSQFFTLYPEGSSNLRVKQRIDREQLCATEKDCCPSKENRDCKITLHVNANRDSMTEASLQVEVHITDVNDNGCSFRVKSQNISFYENEAQGQEVIETPHDPDAMYPVRKDKIRLQPATGHPFRLRVTELTTLKPLYRLEVYHVHRLDREERSSYSLQVIADDGEPSHACSMTLHITVLDVNDNVPVFDKQEYAINVSESKGGERGLPAVLLRVRATDKDVGENARLHYAIETALASRAIASTFALNSTTGELLLLRRLQYDQHRSYIIPILARDSGTKARTGSATITVSVIDENNNAPDITVRNMNGGTDISIPEGLDKRVSVASISVSDADSGQNGRVNCTLVKQPDPRDPTTGLMGSNAHRAFDFKPMGLNRYQVISERAFDRERESSVSFTIWCTDLGTPPLTRSQLVEVTIQDVNDHRPVFVGARDNTYRINVLEDAAPARASHDYKFLEIRARDDDINANGHVQYRLNSPAETRAATDGMSVVDSSLVRIESRTGWLYTHGNLNREQRPRFHFEVVAYDAGTPSLSTTATVYVIVDDYNDHLPVFKVSSLGGPNGYNMHIVENSPANTLVGQVIATDEDAGANARITFHLDHESHTSTPPFKVSTVPDPSGDLGTYIARIYTTKVIDRESLLSGNSRDINPVYNLMLVAQDGGRPTASSSVHLSVHVQDENDETPTFSFPISNTTIKVSYLEPADFQIMKMETKDNDAGENGTVEYRILSGNENGYFAVDPRVGSLRLAIDLPRSAIGHYALMVQARDLGRPSLAAHKVVPVTIINSTPVNLKRLQGGRTAIMNLYIIVAIVVGSAIISVVLLTAICIVIRRSRREARDAKPTDFPLCPAGERRDSYDASYPSTGGYHTARREVTFSPNTMDSGSYQSRYTQYHEMTPETKRGSVASNADKDSGNGDSLDVNSGPGHHRFATHHGNGGSPYTACVTPVMRTFSPNGASLGGGGGGGVAAGTAQMEPYTPLSFESRSNVITLDDPRAKKLAIATAAPGTLPRRKQNLEASFV